MYDFPSELLVIIFKNLSIYERNNCRLVSKQFKQIIDSIRVSDLLLGNDYVLIKTWYMTNDPVDLNNYFPNIKFKSSLEVPTSIEKSLKRLKINTDVEFTYFETSKLSKFKQLEQLEIGQLIVDENDEPVDLPNLKRLYINEAMLNKDKPLSFDLPKLDAFYSGYDVLESVYLYQASQVRYLEIDNPDADSLADYKNVEILKCNNLEDLKRDVVSMLPRFSSKLSELHCGYSHYIGSSKSKKIFNFLLQYKIAKKLNYKFYFCGILQHQKKFEDYDFNQDELSLHMRNYPLLDHCFPWLNAVDYVHLLELVNDRLPSDFFVKYPNIVQVTVSDQVDSNKLMMFLKNCRSLRKLTIENALLSQEFFNDLSTLNGSITELKLYGEQNTAIKYDFIYKFEFLHLFDTDQQLPIELASDLVKALKYCESFEFEFNSKMIKIRKRNRIIYDLFVKEANLELCRKHLCCHTLERLMNDLTTKN